MSTGRQYGRALDISGRVARAMASHGAFEAAAAVAFWFFLSLVPLLVVVGFLVGQIARARGVDALVAPLLDVVPATAEGIVRAEVQRLAGASTSPLAPIGVASYLWTASTGLHRLMNAVEATAGAARRPGWKQRAVALLWVLVGLATACALAWLLVRVDPAAPDVQRHLRAHAATAHRQVRRRFETPGEPAIAAALMLVAGVTLLAGFYRFAVDRPRRTRPRVWPGAVAAVVCWLVVSWGFGLYAASIADYALYYGSLAAVAVLLVWLYLTSLSLVMGAEVNTLLEATRAAPPRRERDEHPRARVARQR